MNDNRFLRDHWPNHLARLDWKQGEHVAVVGPTGCGKTSLVGPLLQKRSDAGGYTLAFITKTTDDTLGKAFPGYKRYTSFPSGGIRRNDKKVLLWPKPGRTVDDTMNRHLFEFRNALDWVARVGSVCLYIDEMLYVTDMLRLEKQVSFLHYNARSAKVSCVTSSQRPFRIPRVILSSISHAYIARTRDREDIKRLSDLGSVNASDVAFNLGNLPDRHDFVYVNAQGDAASSVINTRR